MEALLKNILEEHPGSPRELKTARFMRGGGGWGEVSLEERKTYLKAVCELAIEKGDKICGIGIRLSKHAEFKDEYPFKAGYWLCSGLFVASLIQKRMQSVSGGKGLTALVMDDHQIEMPKLSTQLHEGPDWFDGLYQIKKKRGWIPRTDQDRFDHIVNTGFSIKSEHASLIQVADAICWTYRRSMELSELDEEWEGERDFYLELKQILDDSGHRLGTCPESPAKTYYGNIVHDEWRL